MTSIDGVRVTKRRNVMDVMATRMHLAIALFIKIVAVCLSVTKASSVKFVFVSTELDVAS